MISVQPVTWKLSQKNIILEGLQQLMLLFEISLTGISPFSLIDQLHGNFGLAAAGHYKAAKLFMSGHVLAVFTSSCSLTLEKQFQFHGSVESQALKPSVNCNKQNDPTLLHFHLKDIKHPHPQMV